MLWRECLQVSQQVLFHKLLCTHWMLCRLGPRFRRRLQDRGISMELIRFIRFINHKDLGKWIEDMLLLWWPYLFLILCTFLFMNRLNLVWVRKRMIKECLGVSGMRRSLGCMRWVLLLLALLLPLLLIRWLLWEQECSPRYFIIEMIFIFNKSMEMVLWV